MGTVRTTPVVVTDMKKRVEDILMSVSWRDFASTYFQKSSSWFYHKMYNRENEMYNFSKRNVQKPHFSAQSKPYKKQAFKRCFNQCSNACF